MRALLLLALPLFGCDPPCTLPGAYRCSGRDVQVCSSSSRWLTVASCAEVTELTRDGRQWSCQIKVDGGVAACLPEVAK